MPAGHTTTRYKQSITQNNEYTRKAYLTTPVLMASADKGDREHGSIGCACAASPTRTPRTSASKRPLPRQLSASNSGPSEFQNTINLTSEQPSRQWINLRSVNVHGHGNLWLSNTRYTFVRHRGAKRGSIDTAPNSLHGECLCKHQLRG